MTPRFPALLTLWLGFAPSPAWGQNAPSHPEIGGVQRPKTPPEEFRCEAAAPLRIPIHVGRNVQKSKLRSSVQLVYPPGSEGAGKIMLQVTINENGAVYSIRFLDCPTSLKEAVRAAVCQWRYNPTYLQAEPVPVMAVVELSYNFARYRV